MTSIGVHHRTPAEKGQQDYDGMTLSKQSFEPDKSPTKDDLKNKNGETIDDETISIDDLTGEDVQPVLEVSISRAATRLAWLKDDPDERAATAKGLNGERHSESDSDATPIAEEVDPNPLEGLPVTTPQTLSTHDVAQNPWTELSESPMDMSKGELPTPWHAEARPFVVERSDASRVALRDLQSQGRRRTLSGSGESLKRFLPSMPSMAKASSYIPSLPSLPNFSNFNNLSLLPSSYFTPEHGTKPKNDKSVINSKGSWQQSPSPQTVQPSVSPARRDIAWRSSEENDLGEDTSSLTTQVRKHNPMGRRLSDTSMLYHTLSRASSLGDDTRFQSQHEQINNRFKAIKDSLQDRSSFRLPAMSNVMRKRPSIGFGMPPSLNITQSNRASRWRRDSINLDDGLPYTLKSKPPFAHGTSRASADLSTGTSTPETASQASLTTVGASHTPFLDQALNDLTGDIVIMGGYRGSILRSRATDRQLWVPMKVGLNIRKVDLEVGLDPKDEEDMEEHIYASGMLQNIGPIDISRRLFKKLNECENAKSGKLRVWDYGYDWRLSPHLLSRKLIQFLKQLPSNRFGTGEKARGVLVVAHSLGGLVTRHAVNQRPELFSGIVFAGVPQACVNILGPLRNGDAVLLSSRVLTAQVNFTLRTSFALLPLDGKCFVDKNTGEEYPVDFFNADHWINYRWSPCISSPLPPRSQPVDKRGSILSLSGNAISNALNSNSNMKQGHSPLSSPIIRPRGDPQIASSPSPSKTTRLADTARNLDNGTDRTLAPRMGITNPVNRGQSTNSSVSTAVIIPYDRALAYLRRTLAETKKFKQELAHDPRLTAENAYPPMAVMYGKTTPTLYAARVDGREGIACSDAYDDLAFASGDGVVLAKEAMLPSGYHCVNGGRISSDRGHVTLLGDLNAVGKALSAVMRGRAKGLGIGNPQ